jgi:myosin heavy subunit
MDETEVESSERMVNDVETWQETCWKILAKERIGLDDMTELEHVDDHTIAENLRIRLLEEQIYVSLLDWINSGTFSD